MRVRRLLGILLLIIAPYLLLTTAISVSEAVQHNPGGEIQTTLKGTSVSFFTDRTATTFNGDCVRLRWNVEGGSVSEIFVVDAPSMGAGDFQNCDGTQPRLRIVFHDGTSHTWTIPLEVTFDNPAMVLRVGLWVALSCVLLVAGIGLTGIYRWRVLPNPLVQYALALVAALTFVFVIDQFTNSLNTYRYYWDHYHYINMAEHGVLNNSGLVAPYAYRPIIPFLAGEFSQITGRSITLGFRLITYAGVVSQLVLTFMLARQFTRKTWIPWLIMLVIGVSTFHVKFLLFDVFRPDSLAYSLLLIGMIALFKRQQLITSHVGVQHAATRVLVYDAIILAITAVGMLVREFCIIPVLLLSFHLLREFIDTRRKSAFMEVGVLALVTILAYWLPRHFIVVGRSDQFLESNLTSVLAIVLNTGHHLNVMLGFTIYVLPLLILITPRRDNRLWVRAAAVRLDLILYTLIVLALSFVGGSDIARFTAYLFVPLIVLLTLILDDGVHPVEIAYLLLATAIYNRILSPIPMTSLDDYLDFYIVWYNRTSLTTQLRTLELLGWLLGAWIMRLWLPRKPAAAPRLVTETG